MPVQLPPDLPIPAFLENGTLYDFGFERNFLASLYDDDDFKMRAAEDGVKIFARPTESSSIKIDLKPPALLSLADIPERDPPIAPDSGTVPVAEAAPATTPTDHMSVIGDLDPLRTQPVVDTAVLEQRFSQRPAGRVGSVRAEAPLDELPELTIPPPRQVDATVRRAEPGQPSRAAGDGSANSTDDARSGAEAAHHLVAPTRLPAAPPPSPTSSPPPGGRRPPPAEATSNVSPNTGTPRSFAPTASLNAPPIMTTSVPLPPGAVPRHATPGAVGSAVGAAVATTAGHPHPGLYPPPHPARPTEAVEYRRSVLRDPSPAGAAAQAASAPRASDAPVPASAAPVLRTGPREASPPDRDAVTLREAYPPPAYSDPRALAATSTPQAAPSALVARAAPWMAPHDVARARAGVDPDAHSRARDATAYARLPLPPEGTAPSTSTGALSHMTRGEFERAGLTGDPRERVPTSPPRAPSADPRFVAARDGRISQPAARSHAEDPRVLVTAAVPPSRPDMLPADSGGGDPRALYDARGRALQPQPQPPSHVDVRPAGATMGLPGAHGSASQRPPGGAAHSVTPGARHPGPYDPLDARERDFTSVRPPYAQSRAVLQWSVDPALAPPPFVATAAYDPRGDPSRAHDPRGDPSRAHDPRGDPSRAHDPRGDPSRAHDPRGDPSRAHDPRGDPSLAPWTVAAPVNAGVDTPWHDSGGAGAGRVASNRADAATRAPPPLELWRYGADRAGIPYLPERGGGNDVVLPVSAATGAPAPAPVDPRTHAWSMSPQARAAAASFPNDGAGSARSGELASPHVQAAPGPDEGDLQRAVLLNQDAYRYLVGLGYHPRHVATGLFATRGNAHATTEYVRELSRLAERGLPDAFVYSVMNPVVNPAAAPTLVKGSVDSARGAEKTPFGAADRDIASRVAASDPRANGADYYGAR